MATRITKMPQQALQEKQMLKLDSVCPCCGHQEWLGTYYIKGIFRVKKVSCYSCSDCGCEWECEKDI